LKASRDDGDNAGKEYACRRAFAEKIKLKRVMKLIHAPGYSIRVITSSTSDEVPLCEVIVAGKGTGKILQCAVFLLTELYDLEDAAAIKIVVDAQKRCFEPAAVAGFRSQVESRTSWQDSGTHHQQTLVTINLD
jgi:hypothetical protein